MRYYKDIEGQRVWFRPPLNVDGTWYANPSHDTLIENGWSEYIPEPIVEEEVEQGEDA